MVCCRFPIKEGVGVLDKSIRYESKTASFHNVMDLKTVEEVPVVPLMGGWIAKFSGVPPKELLFDSAAIVKAQIKAQKAIGYDALFGYIDPLYVPEAFGCPLLFRSSGADVSPLEIESDQDIKTLRIPDIRRDGRLPLVLRVVEDLVNSPEREVPVLGLVEGPFTTSSRIWGADKMMKALIKHRAMVERMLEKVAQLLSDFGQSIADIGVDGLIIADPVSSSTMISPEFYDEYVLPPLQHLIKSIGIPVILHVCGNTQSVLPLMAETGARILSLDQCMDLGLAKEIVADRCGIGGNVDPIQTLLLGTPDDVKRETLRCLKESGKKGFILMAGCAVPPGTPLENLKAMIETARDSSSYT
jgi:uroporphyrinogen decarboxylase